MIEIEGTEDDGFSDLVSHIIESFLYIFQYIK